MKILKHWKVPFGFKYNFERHVCVPLTMDSTPSEKLHQYVGIEDWYEVPYEEEDPEYRDE